MSQVESNVELIEETVDETTPESKIDTEKLLKSNSLRVAFQNNNFFLPQLYDMIRGDRKRIELSPKYQRRSRWTKNQKSKLIESLILNVPIPSIYLYESGGAEYEVMDGQQRLLTITEFLDNEFKLTGLKILEDQLGKSYSDLSRRVRTTLDRASINTIVLLLESDIESDNIDLTSVIFERLNTGGTKLNPQEIRNALYTGEYNEAIQELTEYPTFLKIFYNLPKGADITVDNPIVKNSKIYTTMKDCELVLRFFALKDESNLRGSLNKILDRELNKEKSKNNIKILKDLFKTRIDFLYNLFDKNPFVIEISQNKKNISVNLYDSLMVAIHKLWEFRDVIQNDKENVYARLKSKFDKTDNDDYLYLTGKIPGAESIRKRIELAEEILMPEGR